MLLDEYRELTRVLHDLQEGAMRARMVSVATMARPLSRAARELARDAGKQVELEVVGEETELDRHVLEGLREPLVALVRNAVDHGIELPAERMAAGKPAVGRVRVHAMQIAGDVIVSVADDGRGIDLDRVRARLPDGRGMSDDEALEALFRSGVSTADRVTGVSGRGVGLDAVRAAVDALRGRVEVRTAVGAGSEFRIRVPLTLAIQRCVVVEAGGSRYAIPLAATVALVAPSSVEEISAEGRPAVWFGGEALPVSDLAAVVGTPAPPARGAAVVLSTPAGRHALRVDAVRPQRDVVVKALGRHVPRLDLVAGASAEPDGTAMVVLDATGLIEAAATAGPLPPAPPELAAARASRGRVLVVDDALTVRELQRSILERAGYQVRTAPGGAAALALLEAETVDLVLTDVEMPGMDGFALTQAIRADPARAGLPVVILTSREDDSDRRRGMEAGADGYLVKSTFDEHALVTAVARLLGEGADR
jgi:two-component system chemotaxis sensor kinase CheA